MECAGCEVITCGRHAAVASRVLQVGNDGRVLHAGEVIICALPVQLGRQHSEQLYHIAWVGEVAAVEGQQHNKLSVSYPYRLVGNPTVATLLRYAHCPLVIWSSSDLFIQ